MLRNAATLLPPDIAQSAGARPSPDSDEELGQPLDMRAMAGADPAASSQQTALKATGERMYADKQARRAQRQQPAAVHQPPAPAQASVDATATPQPAPGRA